NATTSVAFTQFTVDKPIVKGTVRDGDDPLPADNVFHFTISPSAPVSLLVVTNPDSRDSALYLSQALAIGTTPVFRTDTVPVTRVTPASFDKRAVIILNDVSFPSAGANGTLKKFVEA